MSVEQPVQFEYLEPPAFCPATNPQAKHESNAEETWGPSVGAYNIPSKKSRLDAFIKKIAPDIDYIDSFNRCVVDYLKLLLRDNKTTAVKYMKECFDTLLEGPDFLAWLARKVDAKFNRFKNLLATNQHNKRNSHISHMTFGLVNQLH